MDSGISCNDLTVFILVFAFLLLFYSPNFVTLFSGYGVRPQPPRLDLYPRLFSDGVKTIPFSSEDDTLTFP